jgi:hypothetical protein
MARKTPTAAQTAARIVADPAALDRHEAAYEGASRSGHATACRRAALQRALQALGYEVRAGALYDAQTGCPVTAD